MAREKANIFTKAELVASLNLSEFCHTNQSPYPQCIIHFFLKDKNSLYASCSLVGTDTDWC